MKFIPKLIVPFTTVLSILVVLFAIVGTQTRAQDKEIASPPRPAVEGMAVIINKTLSPAAELPDAEMLKTSPDAAANNLRKSGLQVYTSDTERCLAVTGKRTPTEAEIKKGDLPDDVLAATLAGTITKEQLAQRDRGYLRLEVLSPFQRQIVEQMAKRHNMLDKNGQPTEAKTQLMVGIYRQQVVYKVRQKGDTVSIDRFDILVYPPTEAAVEAPKLRGSLLWWIWPHANAAWGGEPVSLARGTYTLKDLAAKLGETTSWKVEVDRQVPEIQLAATAEQMPLRKMLWAVAVASGLQVRVLPGAKVAFLATRVEQQPEGLQGATGDPVPLFQLPGSGYATPLTNEALREMLDKNEDFKSAKGEKILGWKLSELPLLYREMLTKDTASKRKDPNAQPDDLKDTNVFWTQGVHVSVGLFNKELGGGGRDFFFPAL